VRTLRQSLLDRDPAFLEVIARYWGVVLESSRKGEVVNQLESALLQPEAMAATLADLSPQERAALDTLLAAGGRIPAATFIRNHGPIRPIGPGRLRREEPWRQPASGAEGLWFRGLIARSFEIEAPETEMVYIPSDLLPLLPSPPKEAPPFDVAPASPPTQVRAGGLAFRQDVCTFLIYLHGTAVQPSSKGALPQRHRKRLLRVLLEKDLDRLTLIEHLAQELGLIERRDRRLQLNPSLARAWLRASPTQQLRALQEGWRDSSDWNELWQVPSLQCEPTGWRNDPGGYLTGFESWDKVEGALIHYFLTRPLLWLGVVMLGMDGEEAVAFQVTPEGETFLNGREPPESKPTPPLTVASDLTIQVPLEGSLYDRFQVARFATRVKDAPPFSYRVTPESLARSRERGIALSQIIAFLERAMGGKLPPNVSSLLADWDRKADKVALRHAVLLQTADELTLKELQSLPQIRDLLQEVLGPRAALVTERDWPRLVQALKKLGYLPKVEGLGRGKP